MAWNITHEPGYAAALENDWSKRMKTLRFRTEHLLGLSSLPEDQVVTEFAKAAPHWADERKSLDRVEDFLFSLLRTERYSAHAGCIAAWGQEIHKKSTCFHSFFKVENLPRIVDRQENFIILNPDFNKESSFEAVNAYLAIDPMGCLEAPKLLSGSWVSGLSDERNRDAATVAIFSAFYRYGDQKDRHANQESYYRRSGRVGHTLPMLDAISESAGVPFSEILRSLPPLKKASPAVNRFYSELVAYRQGTSGANLTYALNNIHAVMVSGGLFELAMQARIFSTVAHGKTLDKRLKRDDDDIYYNWVISSEFSCLSEIKAVIVPGYLTADHLAAMHEKGYAVPYLKSLPEDDLMDLIGKGIVLPKYLSKASDRGRLLETDLGM